MKVVFLTRKWSPAVGGMETYCVELTREIKPNVDLTLFALPGRADGSAPGFGAILGFGARTLWRIMGRARRYDVVHGADMAIWPLVCVAGVFSSKAVIVLSAHGTDVSFAQRAGPISRLYRLYMALGARLLRRARVIANSQATAKRARALGFKFVDVVPLATRMPSLPAVGASEEPPAPYILFVGRLVRRKGLGWFISEVLPHLPAKVTLRVAGTLWDETERAALEANRVEFLGPVHGQALNILMAEALCVVLPNIPLDRGHFEGFGLVAVEAAAAGGVVIASRMDGFTDSVIDGETGLLVEPMSGPDWIAAISTVAGWSPDTRNAFTSAARAKCATFYTWQRVARQTVEIYRSGHTNPR